MTDNTAAKEYQLAIAHENSLLAWDLPGGYHCEAGDVNLPMCQNVHLLPNPMLNALEFERRARQLPSFVRLFYWEKHNKPVK
jgi:hypothetical protein